VRNSRSINQGGLDFERKLNTLFKDNKPFLMHGNIKNKQTHYPIVLHQTYSSPEFVVVPPSGGWEQIPTNQCITTLGLLYVVLYLL
jgi:hypothetical protein